MLLGKPAPSFSCKAVVKGQIKTVSLQDYDGMAKVLVFYPADFSFVCPTELRALQEVIQEFEKRKTVVLAISVDSVYSHLTWLGQPAEQGGIKGISFPLLSDITKTVSKAYEVLDENEGTAFRGLFLIDSNNIIQSIQINNASIGRNIHEILRLLDAIQFVSEHGEACPANWLRGDEPIKKTHEGVVDYFKHQKH